MSDWNGFGGLDLSGVDADTSKIILKPGSYACRIASAEVKDTRDKRGKVLELLYVDNDGAGEIKDWINLKNSNPEAERMGLEKLKGLLVAANHPNPNKPGDVRTLVGLDVGVRIERSEDWTDDKGMVRPGGGKVRRYGAYFDLRQPHEPLGQSVAVAEKPRTNGTMASNTASIMSDDIPF